MRGLIDLGFRNDGFSWFKEFFNNAPTRGEALFPKDQAHKFSHWMRLFTVCLLVMITLGGLTRLTGSGLSIVTWKPLSSWLPPLSAEAWALLFQQYQASPEFQKVNFSFSVDDFKSIFWLEYIHRLWGRLMGLILLPPTYYAFREASLRSARPALFLLWFLGLFQGALGWYMVKSGLILHPWVSPYRLTAHLLLGLLLYTLSLNLALGYSPSVKWMGRLMPFARYHNAVRGLLLLLGGTFIWGGLTAGHKAGLLYTTFPFMDNQWLPENSFIFRPFILNFFENPGTVQWTHRVLALLTFTGSLCLAYKGYRLTRAPLFLLWIAMSVAQVTLGAITVIFSVPVMGALLHQLGAFFLWTLIFIGERGLTLEKKRYLVQGSLLKNREKLSLRGAYALMQPMNTGL